MSRDEGVNRPHRHVGRAAESAAAISRLPGGQYGLLPARQLSRSTQFGIRDVATGKWLIRFDKAHKGVEHAHVNINPKFSGVPDPHIKVPEGVVNTLGTGGKVLRSAGKVAVVAGVAIDAYRLGSDVARDMRRKGRLGKRTGKTAASIGGGWAGGLGGSAAGNTTGAWIGGAVGSLCGGVGAVPGAVIGSFLGAVVGGIAGGIGGSVVAEAVVNDLVSDSDDDDDDDDDDDK